MKTIWVENKDCPVCKKPVDSRLKVWGGEVGTVVVTFGNGAKSLNDLEITDKIYYVHTTGYPTCQQKFYGQVHQNEKESEAFLCGYGKEWDRLEAEEYDELHRDDPKPEGVGL